MSKDMQAVFAGFGGQGTLFSGKVVAYAGLIEGREVSWFPSYGPEMRGGTANCSVTVSDGLIGSPLVTEPDAVIAMNQPSYDKFVDLVKPGGVIVADTSMVAELGQHPDVRVIGIPATQIAEEAGLKGLANIVLLGRLFAEEPFCALETVDAALQKCIPPKKAAMLDKNRVAFKLGTEA
ncbi:MAG: 2-oxoacid:acceptor oxidoreductase family protein [Eggerthellaceae bacterium]|nr:2-oxoacid:acceptor oxidoreductase family protein [Eggerthellaceae bacterium]